jgi:hypothetical protein
MVIGCCSIKFYLHANRSLKEKRRVVRAIKDRLKNSFNVSVAEVGDQDRLQSLHIGICCGVGPPVYDGLMTKVVDAVDRMNLVEITRSEIETLSSENF